MNYHTYYDVVDILNDNLLKLKNFYKEKLSQYIKKIINIITIRIDNEQTRIFRDMTDLRKMVDALKDYRDARSSVEDIPILRKLFTISYNGSNDVHECL